MRGARVTLAIAGVGLLVGLLYLLSAVRGPRDALRSEGRRDEAQAPAGELAEPSSRLEERTEVASAASAAPSAIAPAPAREQSAHPLAELDFTVRDADGEVVPDVALELVSAAPPHPEGYPVAVESPVRRTQTSDAAGRARFDELRSGTYRLDGVASDGRWARRTIGVHPGRTYELKLPAEIRPRSLVVRVLGTDERPVAGARVELTGALAGATDGAQGPEEAAERVVTSDAEGRATFAGAFTRAVLLATTPDGRTGWANYLVAKDPKAEPVLIVDRPGALEGELVGLPPTALPRARVQAHALSGSNPYSTTLQRTFEVAVVEGRYRFDALPAGQWTLGLDDPDGARLVLGRAKWGGGELPNSLAPLMVEVRAGATSVQDLSLVLGAMLEGSVRTRAGQPVAGAEVRATFAPVTSNFPDGFRVLGVNVWRYDSSYVGEHPLTHPRTRTDAEGRYRLAGLPPGKLRVEVLAAGLSYDRREDVELADGATTRLEHELEPSGAIEGVEPNAGYLAVRKLGEERPRKHPRMIAILPADGRFCFPGLEAGPWRL